MLDKALKIIRESHGMTATDAAAALGLSNSHLSEMEHGKKTPSIATIEKYSRVFDIPVSSIMFFSEMLDRPETPTANRVRHFLSKKIIDLLEKI
jgi:transcriptional regulator with XRE-family HTH domain